MSNCLRGGIGKSDIPLFVPRSVQFHTLRMGAVDRGHDIEFTAHCAVAGHVREGYADSFSCVFGLFLRISLHKIPTGILALA